MASKCPAVRDFNRISTESHDKTIVRVFDVCLETPSDSQNYFGFVVDEFPSTRMLTRSKTSRDILSFWVKVASKSGKSCTNKAPYG